MNAADFPKEEVKGKSKEVFLGYPRMQVVAGETHYSPAAPGISRKDLHDRRKEGKEKEVDKNSKIH